MRCIKAISQAKQEEWMRWESVEQRKMGWQDLWSMEESRISVLIRSTYDVIPSPQKLLARFGLLGAMTKYCDVWL